MMKGLLLKDWYLLKGYGNTLLVIPAFLIGAFLFKNTSYLIMVVAVTSLLPMNLISYDEKARWEAYCGTLPCSKAQMVSAKYLIGLLVNCGVIIVSSMIYLLLHWNSFALMDYLTMLLAMLALSLIIPTFSLPPAFLLGTEAGKSTSMLIVVGVSFVAFALLLKMVSTSEFTLPFFVSTGMFSGILLTAVVVLYVLSWLLSIWLYQKRAL